MQRVNQKEIAEMQQETHFFFNDTATTEIYTLSLHDALPISKRILLVCTGNICRSPLASALLERALLERGIEDRKSTRLNSSHSQISYAVFCLKEQTPH